MPFANKIRLPFFVSQPQFTADEEVYLKGNGKRIVLNATISKELEGKTDWMPKEWHERFTIALRHDDVSIVSQQFTGAFRINGSYEIEWQDFLNYPTAPAKFKGFEDGFSARSNLCNVCAETSQLELADDFRNVSEGFAYSFNVTDNDFIGCGDPVFEIAYSNNDYIQAPSIDNLGNVSFTMKDNLVSVSQVVLVTYRVTCGAESATANIVGGVTGTAAPICPQPVNVQITLDENDTVPVKMSVTWEAPDPAPDNGYHWHLERVSDGSLVGTGSTGDLFLTVNALDFNTEYRLRLYGSCGSELSIPVVNTFTTPAKPDVNTPHQGQNINLTQVSDGDGLKIEVDFASDIAVEDDIYISGTLTSYAPYYSPRSFDITIPAGETYGITDAIFGQEESTNAIISNVSIYPASSRALNQNLIIDFTIMY